MAIHSERPATAVAVLLVVPVVAAAVIYTVVEAAVAEPPAFAPPAAVPVAELAAGPAVVLAEPVALHVELLVDHFPVGAAEQ